MLMPTKDEIITCPYDNVHRVARSRIQTHLVKCKKNFPDTKLIECPLNATHKVWEPELNFHLSYLCTDRGKIDNYVSRNEQETKCLFNIPAVEIEDDGGENWDNEDHPTYNPLNHCENNPVIYIKNGLKPSKRKEHRLGERKRIQQLKYGPNNPDNQSTTDSDFVPVKPAPMRLPNTRPKTMENVSEFRPQYLPSFDKGDSDGFIKPRIACGRGRGRITNFK